MAEVLISNLERDGETRPFAAHGHAVVGSAGGEAVLRGVFEPGWRWSADIAPIAGTATCQTRHLGYVLSGRMQIKLEDGREAVIEAGDLFDLPAGHDAWVLGDEPCVMIDHSPEATRYATSFASPGGAVGENLALVRRGYAAFNDKDIPTLMSILSPDVVQHVPGSSQVAGDHRGIDAVLGYYGKLGELTDGSFRADLVDVHGDGVSHVNAVHQIRATRNGVTRVSRGSILFTFQDGKATDMLELHGDLAGDDAFLA
ncbi:MAG: nuclear transport factor 2 family protein [Pseudonocardiales bacterium]